MDDGRVWGFEESLWVGDRSQYEALIDDECLMVLPAPPYVLSGREAIDAVASTPRWTRVELTDRQVARPQEGLIVIAYHAHAEGDGTTAYEAHCTSVFRRLAHDEWSVVQHQQTPKLVATA